MEVNGPGQAAPAGQTGPASKSAAGLAQEFDKMFNKFPPEMQDKFNKEFNKHSKEEQDKMKAKAMHQLFAKRFAHAARAGHKSGHGSGAGHKPGHGSGAGHKPGHRPGAGHRPDWNGQEELAKILANLLGIAQGNASAGAGKGSGGQQGGQGGQGGQGETPPAAPAQQ